MQRISFLGCPIDTLDYNGVLNWMAERIISKTPSYISVANANKLWMIARNTRLEKIIKSADLIVPEWAVYAGARILGFPVTSCVYGVVLAKMIIPWAHKNGYSIYFLGAKPEVVEQLVNKLFNDYPGLQIAGYHNGYLNQDESRKVIQEIQQVKPDVILVAMGSPRQEYWINEAINEICVSVSIGVGGSFDVLAGIKKDSPEWARGHGLEWLYRLSQDPKAYWKRYLVVNSWIIWKVFQEYLNKKFNKARYSL